MSEEEMSDEEALLKLASAMKDSNIPADEKHNLHTFLFNIVQAVDTTKVGNLRDDKELNELGIPKHTVRGLKEMALISDGIMGNSFFKEYFEKEAEMVLGTSLSREGFMVRQGTTQVKQVADVTRRRITKKGWGKKQEEEIGGDPNDRR